MKDNLEKLIGKIVKAQLPFKEIVGIVTKVNIEDFYFYEKNEPMFEVRKKLNEFINDNNIKI